MPSCASPLPVKAQELRVRHRLSENAGSERTTTICSNNGVELQSNACMKAFALSYFSELLRQNGHKRRTWRNGAWAAQLMPLTRMASLASSDQRERSEKIITALFRSPCVN